MKRAVRLLSVACLAFIAFGQVGGSQLAFADTDCQVFDDPGDRYRIGQYAIGTRMIDILGQQALLDCVAGSAQTDDIAVCHQIDETSVAIQGRAADRVEDTVVEVARVTKLDSFSGNLIADIRFGDSIHTVGVKLNALPDGFPSWTFRVNGSRSLLYTSNCLRAATGAVWQYLLSFSADGRLEAAEAMIEGYESPI